MDWGLHEQGNLSRRNLVGPANSASQEAPACGGQGISERSHWKPETKCWHYEIQHVCSRQAALREQGVDWAKFSFAPILLPNRYACIEHF